MTADVEGQIERFERRSFWLQVGANLSLAVIALLLAASIPVVYLAPSITAQDFGLVSPEQQAAIVKQAKDAILAEQKAINEGPVVTCERAMQEIMGRWGAKENADDPTSLRLGGRDGSLTGDGIVRRLEVGQPDTDPVTLVVEACSSKELFFAIPFPQLKEFKAAIAGRTFLSPQEIDLLRKRPLLQQKLVSIDAAASQADRERFGIEIGLLRRSDATAERTDSTLTLRLIQTSVTRFGLLAVIGFFASLMVSLYRYNRRLAAFYTARADVLRLINATITVSDFGIIAAALTPALEFGRAPRAPFAQIAEIVRAAKESTK